MAASGVALASSTSGSGWAGRTPSRATDRATVRPASGRAAAAVPETPRPHPAHPVSRSASSWPHRRHRVTNGPPGAPALRPVEPPACARPSRGHAGRVDLSTQMGTRDGAHPRSSPERSLVGQSGGPRGTAVRPSSVMSADNASLAPGGPLSDQWTDWTETIEGSACPHKRRRLVRGSRRPETDTAEALPREREGPLTCGAAKRIQTPNPLLAKSPNGVRERVIEHNCGRSRPAHDASSVPNCSTLLGYRPGSVTLAV